MHATSRESNTLHEIISDIRRTGRGFAALRDRYIRRAEYLCTSVAFRGHIQAARVEWETEYPQYPICDTIDGAFFGFPWDRQQPPLEGVDRRIAAMRWFLIIRSVEEKSFPKADFYSTSLKGRASTVEFIRACMVHDPRTLIGSVGEYFVLHRLRLEMDMREYDELGIKPEDWELSHVSQTWYIPVYPGMTERDLRDAIPGIIQQIQEVLGPRTVGTRIEALRDDGLTQQAIADRLGLNVKVVQAHLRSCRQAA